MKRLARGILFFIAALVLHCGSGVPGTAGTFVGKVQTDKTIVIERSGKIGSGERLIGSEDETGKTGAVTVRGDGLTVDFAGSVFRGSAVDVRPDARKGTGLVVQGKNITLKHLQVHGYKIGLIARNCPGLKLIDCDLSYNWKQHLGSTLEREDGADWMSYHQNEKEEWLRYGAAVYLQDCDGFEVQGLHATGGQCGLMLTRCNRGLVWNCDLSFLSAIGVGMYRSSENRIMHNKIDWCVRGYSHGVYNRGQDSAGILIYEQSNKNLFAYNSVTHGGDGFFLWAGQHTMDTGEGGCNDNLVFGNDFSHAPTNGIETTFSRNKFIANRVEECDHGVWGGYSFDTLILGNLFGYNNRAIAIEHGQHNRIDSNRFEEDGEAISLWQNKTQDPNWGYPKHHDTVSHDYQITNNRIVAPKRGVMVLRDTKDVHLVGNRIASNAPMLKRDGDTAGWEAKDNILSGPETALVGLADKLNSVRDTNRVNANGEAFAGLDGQAAIPAAWDPAKAVIPNMTPEAKAEIERYRPAKLKAGQDVFLARRRLEGRPYILVDEWGPYDFRRPLLWPRGKSVSPDGKGEKTIYQFEVLGPKGNWKVANLRGVETISQRSGTIPAMIEVTLPAGKAVDMAVDLVYTGVETVDYRGIATGAGKSVPFGYHHFFAPIDWNVRFFVYDQSQEPRTQGEAFAKLIEKGTPVASVHTDQIDYAGYGGFVPGVPTNHFATVADGEVTVPAGEYLLEVTTDDGCRVQLDGKMVMNEWKYQGPTTYTVPVTLSGHHKLHVEHFQIDGYAMLKVNLRPKVKQ